MAKSIEELRVEYLGGASAPSVLYNGEGMENVIHVRVNVGVRKQTVEPLPVKIFSQDIHNLLFLITFESADGTEMILDSDFTVEVMSVFSASKSQRLTQSVIDDGKALWEFDTDYITRGDVVTNYIYIRRTDGELISADVTGFSFEVGLSALDSTANRVAETYDHNYEKMFANLAGRVVILTQAEYDLLDPPNPESLYFVGG